MLRNPLWLAAPMTLFISVSAQAQLTAQSRTPPSASVSSGSPQIEEVVVTARKKVENVQSVPATVMVVDEAKLSAAAVTSFADVPKVAPTLNASVSPDANQFASTMRGLGSEPGNPSFDSSVATYLDNAFLSRDREFSVSMFDMSSLETISGTQTALLGKNSSLGAINLVTTKPSDEFSFNARYQHEFELNSDRIDGGADLPVSSDLKFRVAGFYDSEGGPEREVINGQKYRDNKGGGRVTGVWTPSDKIDVTALAQYVSDVSTGPNAQQIAIYGGAPELLASSFGFPNTINTEYGHSATYSPELGEDRHDTLDAALGVITANFHFDDGVLTSQTAYSSSRANLVQNSTYLPGNGLLAFIPDKSWQITQELRYSSTIGSRFDYVAGLFYIYSRYQQIQTESADYPVGTTPIPVPFPITGSNSVFFDQTDHAISAFGQANYRITDSMTLTGGLRYTDETKRADLANYQLVPGFWSIALNPPVAPFSLRTTTDSLDGSVGLNYNLTSDVMFYVSWGQGTKPGGYADAVSDLQQSYYKPEVAQTSEVGIKSQFFDRTLTLNADAFYTHVADFQVVLFNGQAFVVYNQDVASRGFENQFSWVPVDGLQLYWNNVFADAHDAHNGTGIPFAPRWSGLVGGSYGHDVFGSLWADIDINVNYRSQEISDPAPAGAPILLPLLASLHRLNVSIGLGGTEQGWELRLIGQNLTDQRVYGFDFPVPFVNSPPGTESAVGIPLNPRTIMLQLSIKR